MSETETTSYCELYHWVIAEVSSRGWHGTTTPEAPCEFMTRPECLCAFSLEPYDSVLQEACKHFSEPQKFGGLTIPALSDASMGVDQLLFRIRVTACQAHELPVNWPPTLTPCLLYTSPSPRDQRGSRMPSSA